MSNLNSSWKRFLAVSCSHGHLADPTATDAVLKFAELWKPHTRIHLGDYVDTAAFRGGALSSGDETTSLESDLAEGTKFLRAYRPDILFNGNHDIRLWLKAEHHNAIISECAKALIREIKDAVPRKCLFVEDYNIRKSFVTLGDTSFLHGFMYNENGVRDHAEQFGNCVIGHLHKVQSAAGRRSDSSAVGYCVGYLGDPNKFDYADRNRSISAWSHGFAYGEYSDKECRVWLERRNREGAWRLPPV